MTTFPAHARHRTVLARGLRKRCPHCGRGAIFRRGLTLHERCAVCHLAYLRNEGDPWAFLVVVDRLFILLPVAALYFGLLPASFAGKVAVFAGLALAVLVTTPHRYGLCVALDYLTRVHWGDPSDALPELPPHAA